MRGAWLGLVLAVGGGSARAQTLAEGRRCLRANDVPCAVATVEALGAADSARPAWLAFAAETAFYQGRFDAALSGMRRAVDAGWQDDSEALPLYERTSEVTRGWAAVDRDGVRVRYKPGLDEVLLDDAFETLQRTLAHMEPVLGASPPGRLDLEIYPDGRSFIAASSLTAENVHTTGVVALSKWSRLLVTTPRALGRGYAWRDSVSHELIHRIIAYQTDNRAPVWLQEAVAKYLEHRWRGEADAFELSVGSRALLAEALRTDDLVSFDEMHPSLAKLSTRDRSTLAYAQLATLMAFCFEAGGEEVLRRTLPKVREGEDPRLALAVAAGFSDFAAMEAAWLVALRDRPLGGRAVSSLPTVLDGGDELELDPVLAEREDLARFVRLGDLLRDRGRDRGALVEYRKGIPKDEPIGPYLANRLAQVHLTLGDVRSAKEILVESLADYPEFALSHKTFGALLRAEGDPTGALDAYREAVALNPFDPEVQETLVELYRAMGDETASSRHARYLRILRPGG